MRFFWKIFCSTVVITALSISLGGFWLIDSQFRTSLKREITAAYEENDVLWYAIDRELQNGYATDRESLALVAQSVRIETGRGTIPFRLTEPNGDALFTGDGAAGDVDMLASLGAEQRGYELMQLGERTYVHAASPLTLSDGMVFLENFREITDLFDTRDDQYHRFFYLMLALIAAVGLVTFAVSSLLTRPLRRLSVAVRHVAGGAFNQRVPVTSRDELGKLSADFNAMAERLEAMVDELKDAARRQEDFVGSFAHETKTPLTSIIGYADLLRSRPSSPEQVAESAGYIFTEGKRLEALSRKLMDLIVLDKQVFPLRSVPARVLFERVELGLRPVFANANIAFAVRCEDAVLQVEPDLMHTVLLNLMDNARKAMDGGGAVLLEGVSQPDGGYRISIYDNGKGIPPEELERITEAFYMVDKSRARAQGGAGLGLAICQRIVALHGARLTFRSIPGQGTRVTIFLKGGGDA
ncbi:HAMP domain-containing histidine kinase [Butyricicoccus faecihominis]|uniref:sensor histidine kinase n=1 Tax=Butyricicoccaceae TaxID=3085642 RepID=UPI00247A506B|nr:MULTISPECIES: HAMP domain-containing sensor histidine kinase [Butyricicoccaceae]MCQ5128981.1 HAMP domain-containing histidine kinase [Butyricicoccus faecihominis]WNX85553.1 HAMP domain-containing sensor histidine kinase [Agathobaculum sp. NTUH-O15-33]